MASNKNNEPHISKTWVVKDSNGRLRGPYSTQRILQEIERGTFSGHELISPHPHDQWSMLAKTPEFYDKLLEALVNENSSNKPQASSDSTIATLDDDESGNSDIDTRSKSDGKHIGGKPPQGKVVRELVEVTRTVTKPIEVTSQKKLPLTTSVEDAGSAIIDIEEESEHEPRDFKFLLTRIPIAILVLIAFGFAGKYLYSKPRSSAGRIHLLGPRAGQPALSNEKVKNKFGQALNYFEKDTFSNYLQAQNTVVQMLEGSPKNKEGFGTLCLIYRELWPFAYQDSKDLATLDRVTQYAKKLDPAGLDGATCEIIHMNLTGKFREAKSLTETWLQDKPEAVVLYDLRGEMLFSLKDYGTALPYFEKVSSLWPQWLKGYIQQARAQTQLQKFANARDLYATVLQKLPSHPVAKIELGLIELGQFQQVEKAFELINSGLNQGDKLSGQTESSGYLGLAKIFEQRGQKRKALQAAQKAFAANSSNSDARQMVIALGGADTLGSGESREQIFVGDQYAKAGDCLAAQAEYRSVFDADKKNAVAAMKAGQCLWQLNQSQDALDWLQKAIQADPKLVSAYILLADYFSQRFDFYSAMKVLEKARQISPRSYEIYRGYALLELRRNNFKGAADWATKALQLYDSDMDTSILMARAQLGLGNFTEAQKYIGRAIEMDMNSVEAQSLKAKIVAGVQGTEAGAHYAQELISTYPYVTEYRTALAEIFIQDERWSAAEQTYRQIISIEPNNKPAILGLAKVLQQESRNNDALEMYLRAAILDPSDANPVFSVGRLYYQTGKYADAAAQFQRVLRVNPRYPRGHLSLGQTALANKNPKLALQEAAAEKAINPEMADAYILAAEADYDLKQFSNCAVEFQKAIAKKAQETSVYVRMARCYRRSGALDSALSLLRQASGRESGNPLIYKELGAVYQTKSMADEAIEAYNKYLTLMPNAPDRAAVELQLGRISSGAYDLTGEEL